MNGEVVVFLEGDTEKNVIEKLRKKGSITYDDHRKCGSSRNFRTKLINYLEPIVRKSPSLKESYTLVVLRDLDSGKSVEDIKKSTEEAIKKAFEKTGIPVEFIQHQRYSNIFLFNCTDPEIKVVLHVAQPRFIDGLPEFKNCTTDDYVLDLALRPKTIANLPEFISAKKQKKDLTPEKIQKKVKLEIFQILKGNGIELDEAKKFVNIYIASLQLGEGMTYTHLPGKVIEHAEKEDIKDVYESWIAAFRFTEEFNEP